VLCPLIAAISLLELLPCGEAFMLDFRSTIKWPIAKTSTSAVFLSQRRKSSPTTEQSIPNDINTDVSADPVYPNWRTVASNSPPTSVNIVSPFAHNFNNNFVNVPWSKKSFQLSLNLYQTLSSCPDSYISPLIKEALDSLEHAYRLYGPESVIGSFNGGKDAVVILELMRAAHAKYYHDQITAVNDSENSDELMDFTRTISLRPRVIYFNNKLEFPEVYKFVQETVKEYDLDMIAFDEGVGFVDGLRILVKENYISPCPLANSATTPPYPIAFVLGTRTTDPNAGKQGIFSPSSTWMPSFMRINPVLNWSYGHIWHFLRLFKLPYCTLYNDGYTSLGTVVDTNPCPALKKVETDLTKNEGCEYWPAYMLKDWELERAGRLKKEPKKTPPTAKVLSANREIRIQTIGNITFPINNDDSSAPSSLSSNKSERTVGILIIGDEILKGLISDTNAYAAASALHVNNIPLVRVAVVSDNQDEIIAEIKQMEKHVDVIITSGGVGPTHDNVTIKSVAVVLSSEMVLNDDMAKLLVKKMEGNDAEDFEGQDKKYLALTEAQIKMSTLPACAKLLYLSKNPDEWPVLQCQNMFILPGVPQFFEKKIKDVASYLSTELGRRVTFKVVLSIGESSIVPVLNAVVLNHPNVSFGSYPFVNHPEYKTVVTLEGKKLEAENLRNNNLDEVINLDGQIDIHVKVALSDLVNRLPEETVLRVDNNTAWTLN